QNPGVVKAPPLVSTSATKHHHIYADFPTDRTSAFFPRSVVQYDVVFLKKMIVLAAPLKQRPVFVDSLDDLPMRLLAPRKVAKSNQTSKFHVPQRHLIDVPLHCCLHEPFHRTQRHSNGAVPAPPVCGEV